MSKKIEEGLISKMGRKGVGANFVCIAVAFAFHFRNDIQNNTKKNCIPQSKGFFDYHFRCSRYAVPFTIFDLGLVGTFH